MSSLVMVSGGFLLPNGAGLWRPSKARRRGEAAKFVLDQLGRRDRRAVVEEAANDLRADR